MEYEVTKTFSLDGKTYYVPGEVITEDDPEIIKELLTKKLIKPPPSARKITEPKPKPKTTQTPPPPEKPDNFAELQSVTPELAAEIKAAGIITFEQLETADIDILTQINGVDLVLAERIKKEASAIFSD